jgi:putative cell wall-binding protein
VRDDTVTVVVGVDGTDVDLPWRDRVERLAGATRIETAVAISAATYDAAATVVIGRSDQYADALAGGPLAADLDAPMLLSSRDSLPDAVAEEVQRLGASDAVLLGGEAALSTAVAEELEALGLDVERLAGTDRFATAAAIAARLPGDAAFVVEGINADRARGWPDAIAVAALAAQRGDPILLVERDRLPDATRAALRDRAGATIVGGTAAVSSSVEAEVGDAAGSVGRVAGRDRYETSALVVDLATEDGGLDPRRPWVATGLDWPDALAAGPAAAADGAPLVIAHGRTPTAATTSWLARRGRTLVLVTVTGDRGAVGPAVEAAFRRHLEWADPWPSFPVPDG